MTYISRRLAITEENQTEAEYADADFFALEAPLIILGEPGAGKSALVEAFAASSGSKVYKPSDLQLYASLEILFLPARTIIDGLDEVTAYCPGTPIVQVLSKIGTQGHDNFVLTCRAIDWQHAANSSIIASRWQRKPIVGCLLPLNNQEIVDFINANGGGQDGEDFLNESQRRDVVDLLRNPQNLTMLLKTVQSYGWPNTRSDLYEKACSAFVEEDNDIHRSIHRTRSSTDILLEASGFTCSQLLLSGEARISVDGSPALKLPRATELASGDFSESVIRDTLSTKIFRVVGHDTVEPCHRTMAEYLAAKWLAKALRSQLSLRRLESLLYGNDYIVPSALRGLHAWLATLSPAITDRFIARDPYGFFRYGDPSVLTIPQSKHLLQCLERLADVDPYFRSEDWHATFGRGLARIELRDDIVRVIRNPETPYQLSHLIIESIQGDPFVSDIASDLLALVLDTSATPLERSAAVEALIGCETQSNWADTVDQLRGFGDIESLRVALDIMQETIEEFSGSNIAEVLIGIEEVMAAEDGPNYASLGYGLHKKMSLEQLEKALQVLSEHSPAETGRRRRRGGNTETWVYKFVQERLERGAPPCAATLWSWLSWNDRHGYYRSEWDKYSLEYFSQHPEYRHAVQAEVIKGVADAEDLWKAVWHLGDASPGLWLRESDIILHISALLTNREQYEDWPRRWRYLVQWSKASTDFTGEALELARIQAEQYEELKVQLADLERPPAQDYQKEWQKQERQREQNRKRRAQTRHKDFGKIQNALRAGQHLPALDSVAKAYLGRFSDIREGNAPTDRVAELVGENITPIALEGLAAAAARDDVPTARQMTELRVNEQKTYFFENILLAYCARLLSKNNSLEDLPLPVAASALAACEWGVHFSGDDITGSPGE